MEIIGRLHPLLLHLPIGILALAFLMEWFNRRNQNTTFSPAISFGLKVGMWSAIISAASGYILSLEGGYDENTLFWHQWLGILTAVFSIGVYYLNQKKAHNASFEKAYFPAFSSTIVFLLAAGHFGGSLTHGSDFLIEPFSPKEDVAITDLNSAKVFESFIQPIFKKKCTSCHNESKLKGDLLMSSLIGLKNGGKTGPLFVAGDAENSLMMKRIHMPIEEKKHMPPKGKTQLTEDEVLLLEWWVSEGGDFEKTVGENKVPENIQTILNKYVEIEDVGVFALDISSASESRIQDLREVGFEVYPVAQESPFLDISWKGNTELDKDILKKLKKVSEQVIRLNLSNSNLTDDLFAVIKDLPNLQKLSVNKTEITGKALNNLSTHNYLEVLNLYNTKVDDPGIESIFKLQRLKKLFLWQTSVSDSMITKIRNERPKLMVSAGVDASVFGDARLKPPLIMADKDIFRDSLPVELNINFNGVEVYYTLDGSEPDSTSTKYDTTIYLTQTTNLKVIAKKEGWKTSEVANRFFVHAKYKPVNIKLNKKPSDRYAAEGPKSLGDFKKGTLAFTDGNWVGYEGSHFTATLDLGKKSEVSRVTVSVLEASASWIFYPKGIEIAVSENGSNFKKVSTQVIPTADVPEPPELSNFSEGFDPVLARYVQVKVKSNLKNPDWHPNPGEPCWVFVDEILVE